jgi:RNA polymerase sigma-70 factor (ECF subfamily)
MGRKPSAQESMPEDINKSTIARAKAGDEVALAAIYEAYKSKIQRFLYYRVGDRQAAEDLTTDVFLRMLEHLEGYRMQGTPFQAWLFQIARNLAVDYFRKQGVRNHLALQPTMPANGDSPDTVVARSLTNDQLRRALQQLTDGQSDVIVLRFIAGMSIAEVAETLEKSESAVKSLQARGLDALHNRLSQWKVALIKT